MSNINRDYLIVLNPKTSKVTVPELNYYIYDKYTANLFVNLVTVEDGKVVNMVDADQYKLVLHVLKPTNEIQTVENIQVFNKEKALFQIELDAELTKNIGRYKCELLTIDQTDHIVQSAKFSYRVKKSIYNDLDVVTETPQYPIIITLLDKLQDIDKYEEERRANEVARVAAEKARVKDYTDLRQTVTTDIDTMQQKINSFDGKVQEVDNAVTQMRTNITDYQTKKNTELDNYKTQKDTQINTAIKGMETTIDKYKTEKDTQINDKITQQDNKIDSAIQDQNNTIAANNQAQNKVINDAITEQNKTINTVVENDKKQNDRLDALEYNDTVFITDIEHLQIKDTEHEDRMAAIEAVNVEQNNRLDAIEIKNDQQDGRLNDVEAKNKKQDMDLKCLFAESHSERITLDNEVGNSVFLQNSKQGFATIDELKGNTLVNCNKDVDKELILNGNIDTSGYSTVTTTEGVDGGKVDVALEGNTMVNVCDQEDPIAITKNYEVSTGNHVALQGEYDGKCRPNIYGNTLVNLVNPYDITDIGGSVTYKDNYLLLTETEFWASCNFNVAPKLKPSTTYTLIINILENTTDNTTVYINNVDNDHSVFKDFAWGSQSGLGVKKHILTTVDDLTDKTYSIRTDGTAKNGNYVKIQVMLLEGDYTNKPIPEYFTGMQSSFEDKLITDEKDAHSGKYKVDYKVTGKNLLDESKGVMNSSMGSKTICIKVRPNTSYTYSSSVYKGGIAIYELASIVDNDTDVNNLQNVTIKNFGLTDGQSFTTGSSTNYIFMNYDGESKVQIEEGTTATTYEPYKESIKTLYLNSPLLEGDTIEQSGNDIVHMHRYNKVVFDGSDDENWGATGFGGHATRNTFEIALANTNGYIRLTPGISNSFNNELIEGVPVNDNAFRIVTEASGESYFLFTPSTDIIPYRDVDKWKKYLQANPITVAYELATPTREVISTNDNLLLDSYTNGHLDVDSIVPIDKVVFQNKGFENKYLNPNTDYIIQFESDNIGKIDYIILGGNHKLNIEVTKGTNKILCTSGELGNWLDVVGIGFNASKIVVTPKVDNDFGYFKGMKSVGECEGNKIEILSRNKNLINFTIDNIYNTNPSCTIKQEEDGATSIKASYNSPYWLKEGFFVEKGEKYSITIVGKKSSSEYSAMSFGGKNLNYYNSVDRWLVVAETSGNCITTIDNYGTYKTTATAKNTGYITRFYIHDSNGCNIYTIKNIQIEKADTPTDIIAPKSNKQTITHEPLRGLPNGTKDKYVIIDGKWYIERNCVAVQFKDLKHTQINDYQKAEFPDVIGFRLMNTGLKPPIMCDRFAYTNDRIINFGQLLTNKENINICNNGNLDEFFITIQRAKLKTLDFKGLINYFTENPMEIIAKATTPTYEPIEYNPFEVYTDTTHISNNSNIPCNMVIRNSGYNCMLKPNTTYTVSSNNGLSSVTTKASIGDGILRFYDKDTTSVTKMNKVLVLEGDYITGNPPIPAFFKGMESTFEQELVTDEKDEHYDKYKVNVKATNPDNSQQNNITFYLKEPLRGVGDVKDKVYVKEDKIVVERNCVSYVLDPNKIPSPSPGDTKLYMYNIAANNSIINTGYGKVVCNSFACDVNNAHDRNRANTISTVVDGTVPNGVIRIITDKNKETLKQYLQQNPTTVIYQLATPTYEEVEYFDLKLFVEIFKDTTINYNSNIPVTSTINYTYSTPLTDAVNTVSDISDEQDSMIIDMATQVATMEMMLM